jgi:predicted acetyltransferase
VTVRLTPPNLDRMVEYAAALKQGWSPSNERDISAEQLALYRQGPQVLHDELTRQDGTITTGAGLVVPRLPSRVFWIDDGEVSGYLSLRWQPGTEALPPHCHGHIGYAVVPWKRRRGYATQALALVLPVAREVGLPRVNITCDEDNEPSRRVIVANGAVPAGRVEAGGKTKLSFWIELGPQRG